MEIRANMPIGAPNERHTESEAMAIRACLPSGWAVRDSDGDFRIKRVFDLVGSGILLLVLMPVMVLIGAALAIEGRGQVFFVQERIGRNLRTFRMLKFRTLQPDFDGGRLRRVLSRNDSRLTALGRFLRETGLDELPQLVNVVGGSMSLIGPRPLVAEDALACVETCPERFLVPQGITGLAQVRGRNRAPLEKRLQDDAAYVARHSLRVDIVILFRTLMVPFAPEDAYPCEPMPRKADRGLP